MIVLMAKTNHNNFKIINSLITWFKLKVLGHEVPLKGCKKYIHWCDIVIPLQSMIQSLFFIFCKLGWFFFGILVQKIVMSYTTKRSWWNTFQADVKNLRWDLYHLHIVLPSQHFQYLDFVFLSRFLIYLILSFF